MENQLVMYFVINDDLKMGKGKIASQVAHACQACVEALIREAYEARKPKDRYLTYMKWKKNCTKIVLRGTELQMRELMKRDECFAIIDSGQTQIPENSLTCICFPPSAELGELFKDYKLL